MWRGRGSEGAPASERQSKPDERAGARGRRPMMELRRVAAANDHGASTRSAPPQPPGGGRRRAKVLGDLMARRARRSGARDARPRAARNAMPYPLTRLLAPGPTPPSRDAAGARRGVGRAAPLAGSGARATTSGPLRRRHTSTNARAVIVRRAPPARCAQPRALRRGGASATVSPEAAPAGSATSEPRDTQMARSGASPRPVALRDPDALPTCRAGTSLTEGAGARCGSPLEVATDATRGGWRCCVGRPPVGRAAAAARPARGAAAAGPTSELGGAAVACSEASRPATSSPTRRRR